MVTTRNSGSKSDNFRKMFNSYLTEFCTTVTLRKTTETKDSMDRVISSSTTTTTINADIQWVTKEALNHLNMGNVKIGDGMLFVEYDADISLEDEIEFNSKRWRIVDQIEGEQIIGDIASKGFIIRKNAQS